MRTVLDVENTVTFRDGLNPDGSAFQPGNNLVMVQYNIIDKQDKGYLVFNHTEWKHESGYLEHTRLQQILDETTLLIGHNIKHDMEWLLECGFTYSGALYDTMIFEYVNARGLKIGIGLKDSCDRHGLTAKLGTMEDYLDRGINVDAIPLSELAEYGMGDIQSTTDLYEFQQRLLTIDALVASMYPAIQLMNETLPVIIEMERNGCKIDLPTLDKVADEYRIEQQRLEHLLNDMVAEVVGDTPVNLNSPQDLSSVIYSRKVKSKDTWAGIFRLGYTIRNGKKKPKKPFKYTKDKFKKIVKENMDTVYRTESSQCQQCLGSGKIQKYKKPKNENQNELFGYVPEPYKNLNNCPACEASGYIYTPNDVIAGFRVQPLDSSFVTTNGFATDKDTIELLIATGKLKDKSKEFLQTLSKLNAINTYLSTFIEGIRKNIRGELLLHTSLNQCITATGRLSSSNPNFQNLPRAKTFPVRKCIISRFEGGKILEVDWKQLEYATAILLSNDSAGIESIKAGIDRHKITADALTNAGQATIRQDAKQHTFKPLYGGSTGTEAEQAYYKLFNNEHKELHKYLLKLAVTAIQLGYIQSPSGRVYAFPDTHRVSATYVTNQTQIYNYTIQGFATADIMPAALVILYRLMKENMVQSKLILTVHDSVEIDCHPSEVDLMIRLVHEAFSAIPADIKRRFNFDCCVPLGFEMTLGDNWMDKKEVFYNDNKALDSCKTA